MTIKIAVGAMLLALLSACASTPSNQGDQVLRAATAAVTSASQNPLVHKYAAVQLEKAKDTLSQARASWQNTHDTIRTEHLAYLAKRRAEIAMAAAEKAQAQKQAKTAGKKRKQMQIRALHSKLASLKPRQTDHGLVLTLGNVLFAFDSADLKPQAQQPLDKLADYLRAHPNARVQVNGYTDSKGSKAYNQRLSQQRAQSVANALAQRGVNRNRISVAGYGEANPVASNATAFGRQQNRRVQLVIKNSGGGQAQPPTR